MPSDQVPKPLWAKKIYQGLLRKLPDYWAVQLMYMRYFGHPANLRNPRGYNEKINWRKLYQRDPRFSTFSDKVQAKQEIAKVIGEQYVIPNLWIGRRPEDIPFDQLTPPYVIKVNHTSGHHIFIRSEADVDRKTIEAALREKLRFAQAEIFREWAYGNIEPKILIEPMLPMPNGMAPEDYKFYVFHGRAQYITVVYDRFGNHRQSYYDRDWNLLPVVTMHPLIGFDIARPARFDEMIEIAEKIGALFDYVRVDLYQTPEGIFFGETTFYDGGGIEPIQPKEWELKLGETWQIRHDQDPVRGPA